MPAINKVPVNCLTELIILKSPKFSQIAVGHEGQHAILVSDDGSAYFVGKYLFWNLRIDFN